MKLKDIMSKDVACINTDHSIKNAAELMKKYDCGSIPVCSENQVIGMITDRDITLRSVAEGKDVSKQKVSDIMSDHIISGTPDMDISDAAKIMKDQQIRRLPVIENNSLVGIVALGDISQEPSCQNNAEQALKGISEPAEKMW